MGWKESDRVDLRVEFVDLATREGGPPVAELCRRFEISRTTAYKWLNRAREDEDGPWARDRSRRPRHSPNQTPPATERAILEVRREHPAWGARKIARVLLNHRCPAVPAPSTITEVLRRHGLITERERARHKSAVRFERELPNHTWQMDFRSPVALAQGALCHPLVVVDDCSRYLIALSARPTQREHDVREPLVRAFRHHGLPFEMLMDNGTTWGSRHTPTRLTVWLMRLHIRVSHGRPYHPQTQGKCERLNRSLKAEALPDGARFRSLGECQRTLETFRRCYNHERPHEALDYQVPAERYRPSTVAFPAALAPIEYLPGDIVRRVGKGGAASLYSGAFYIGRPFAGEPVAFRPTARDGIYEVYYCNTRLRRIDVRQPDLAKYKRQSP